MKEIDQIVKSYKNGRDIKILASVILYNWLAKRQGKYSYAEFERVYYYIVNLEEYQNEVQRG